MALDFTAIDFETANSSGASACAVGLARVRGGRVVATAAWLIKPPAGHDDGTHAKGAPDWSQWQPSTGGVSQGAAEIGLHVAPLYRTAAHRQLVEVSGGAMSIAGVPLVTAVRQPQSAGGKISFDDDKGALYQLCGPLSGCRLPGTPSTERGALLQREALELALYSFRYLDGVQQVAVLLPPGAGTSPAHALWFRRDAMDQQLSEPLEATLLPKVPTTTNVRTSPDASLVGELTSQSIFDVSVTRNAQGDNAFLVLDPPTGPTTAAPAPSRTPRPAARATPRCASSSTRTTICRSPA